MLYQATVIVRYKKSVLEPQGEAILLSLKEQGEEKVKQVRLGKILEILVEAENLTEAKDKIKKITEEMLYNPVMETAEFHIEEYGKN